MPFYKPVIALFAAAILASCGGQGNVPPPPPPSAGFTSLVSFGDSFSDVGTYAVGTVKALGGGKYTINAPDARIWIELLAERLGLAPPCPAQTGLDGDPAQGFSVPVANFPECTAYAQGGARVSNPIGRGNKAIDTTEPIVGQLTVPVTAQLQNHLATRGQFRGDEIVFVMAGGNDLFIQIGSLIAGGNPLDAVSEMAEAGDELADLVESIIAAGANHVVVVNLPDAGRSPLGRAAGEELQELIGIMTRTFNSALSFGLDSSPKVLQVDAFSLVRDQADNPAKYGLINTTTPACDLSPERNVLQSSLVCTPANTVPGVTDRYQFADTVHPTPYSHQLLADFVWAELERKGWGQP